MKGVMPGKLSAVLEVEVLMARCLRLFEKEKLRKKSVATYAWM